MTVADAATGTALIVVDEDGENQIAVPCPGVNATIDVDPSAIARGLETGGLPKAQLLFVPPGEGHCAAVTPDEPSHSIPRKFPGLRHMENVGPDAPEALPVLS